MVIRALSLLAVFALVAPMFAQATPSDNKIYDQVREKLANDPDVRGGAIDVTVKAGAVTLQGTVHDDKAREKAERITKKVKGVTSVTNLLKVFGT